MRRLTVAVALALLLASPVTAYADDEPSTEPSPTATVEATPEASPDPQPAPTQEATPEPTREPEPTPTPTPEPVTVTLDIPNGVTYVYKGGTASASWRLSGFTTNSPSGAHITARFSALRSDDGTSIAVSDRALSASCGDGWQTFTYGEVTSATEDFRLLTVDGPVTDLACSFTLRVRHVPNIATHLTGTVSVTATTD